MEQFIIKLIIEKKERMDFETYLELIKATYREYQEACRTEENGIKFKEILDNELKREYEDYLSLKEERMCEIEMKISEIMSDDKKALNDISEDFYYIQEKAFELKIKIKRLKDELYMQREKINNSLV